jgi:hypothetical protein
MFRSRLENKLVFPKELNNIILEYTLVNQTKFFRDYYQPLLHLSGMSKYDCEKCGNTKIFDFGDYTGLGFNTPCSKCGNSTLTHLATFFVLGNCGWCERNTLIKRKYDAYEDEDENDDKLYGCLHCTKFDYCAKAESDTDICQYNLECFICNERTCSHGVASGINSVLCIDCKNTILICKKMIKMSPSDKIKTFDSLLNK